MVEEKAREVGSRGSGRWMGLVVGALVLLGLGFYVGYLVEQGSESANESRATAALGSSELGDSGVGRELFVSKGCVMCHQFEGRGGTDGPPLDFMTGQLTAADIAGMSGQIWNHVPAMKSAFAREGIPFPTFGPGEMEDLISYLHGGGPPPDLSAGQQMGMGMGKKGAEGR